MVYYVTAGVVPWLNDAGERTMTIPARGAAAVLLAILVTACADKAQSPYATCIQNKAKDDVEAAWNACSEAVAADPNSKSGEKAAKLLPELRPEYDRRKALREAAEAKAAEEQRKAQAEARAKAVINAKRKVQVTSSGDERDGNCAGKGLPPYRKYFEGGTFEEDDLVATAAGCVRLFPNSQIPENMTTYCCP
jgi:hypothetical protein